MSCQGRCFCQCFVSCFVSFNSVSTLVFGEVRECGELGVFGGVFGGFPCDIDCFLLVRWVLLTCIDLYRRIVHAFVLHVC